VDEAVELPDTLSETEPLEEPLPLEELRAVADTETEDEAVGE